jgi:hypothetical protein
MALFSRDDSERSNRLQVRQLATRTLAVIFIFMAGVALIFGGYSIIANSSLFVPRSSEGILEDVVVPGHYGWSSESIRLTEIEGVKLDPQAAARGVIVNTENDKFVVIAAGVEPNRVFYTSDSNFTVRLDESAMAESDADWTRVSDICSGEPAISSSTVTMPGPEEFKVANPEVQSDEGTVFGQRAWRLTFQATPEIVEKLMLLPFFTEATAGERTAEWVISNQERELIEAGKFSTDEGLVWINRDGDRQIQQIDLRIVLDNGTKYRFLAQRTVGDVDTALNELDHGDDNC